MADHQDIVALLADLLGRAEEGTLDDAGRARLAALLRDDPAARRAYVRLTTLDVLLEEELAGGGGDAVPPPGLTTVGRGLSLDDDDDNPAADAASPAAADSAALHAERALVLPALGHGSRAGAGAGADDDEAEEQLAIAPVIRRPVPPLPAWWWRWRGALAAAVALGLLGVLIWAVTRPSAPGPVATLAASVDATWDGPPVPVGTRLVAGTRLKLTAGLVEAVLDGGGTRLVVVGPADVTIAGPNAAVATVGSLAAHVPPAARGFRVDAAGLTIIDQGTEFGVAVAPGGGVAEVHVFRGTVTVAPPAPAGGSADAARRPLRLGGGEAVRCDVARGGTMQTMPAAAPAFARALAQISPPAPVEPLARWTFDEPGGPTVVDARESGGRADGTIVGGATRVAGRVGAGALQLDGVNGAVTLGNPPKLDVAGRVTLAAWVRIDDPAPQYQNILVRGYDSRGKGEVYLRIRFGNFEGGTWNTIPSTWVDDKATDAWDHKAVAPVRAADVGRWVHVVGVHDGGAWRLYRDGVEVAASVDPVGATRVQAAWMIGASTAGDRLGPPRGRYFKGAVDDVRVYDVALTAAQVRELYESSAATK